LSGANPPGERLVELQLTARYKVGRAAIRSALVELEKEGLVVRELNRGASVRKIGLDEAIEINEARASLEGLLARHAARRADDDERSLLCSIGEQLREAVAADDTVAYSELNGELHAQIRRIARHQVGLELALTLRNRSAHHQFRLATMPGRPGQSLPEHEAIIEAIVSGNETEAEQAMQRHMSSVIEVLRKWGAHVPARGNE
jgi:DNA-binding GntR family transcriptional regulator